MSNWIVEDRDSGQVVYAYAADSADHFDTFPLEQYNHTKEKPVELPGRMISKVAYLRLFSTQERVAIRAAAKQNAVLEDYLALLELASEINLDDADTVAAVQMLEQVGLIASGRAVEILA